MSIFHPFRSPLRYPGGKRKIAPYIARIIEANELHDVDYVEPYAGGGSIALALMFGLWATRIRLNDADPAVYAFWHSCCYATEDMCRLVRDTPLNMDEWHRQRAILLDPDSSLLERGFSTFFLNRTNRSGILLAGVMGGQRQDGAIQLGDRFNRIDLARRIKKIGLYSCRIELSNLDAVDFLAQVAPTLDDESLIYLDPPYFVKGQGLYGHSYGHRDHAPVAAAVGKLRTPWIVSYDNAPEIKRLYQQYEHLDFCMNYSTQERYQGGEVMFFSPLLRQLDVATTRTMLPAITAPQLKANHQFELTF